MQAIIQAQMDCQPVVQWQWRQLHAQESRLIEKKSNGKSRSSNFILNAAETCLLNPGEENELYQIHTHGLHTSFAILKETTCVLLEPLLRAGGHACSSKGYRVVGSSGIADVTSSWACFNFK